MGSQRVEHSWVTEQQTTVRSDSAHLLIKQNLDYLLWVFLTLLKFQKLSRVVILGSEGHSWTFPPVLWSLSSCFWTHMESSPSLLLQRWSCSQCLWSPLVMLLFCMLFSLTFLFFFFFNIYFKIFIYIFIYIYQVYVAVRGLFFFILTCICLFAWLCWVLVVSCGI